MKTLIEIREIPHRCEVKDLPDFLKMYFTLPDDFELCVFHARLAGAPYTAFVVFHFPIDDNTDGYMIPMTRKVADFLRDELITIAIDYVHLRNDCLALIRALQMVFKEMDAIDDTGSRAMMTGEL